MLEIVQSVVRVMMIGGYPMWPQLNCNMRIRYAGKIIIVPGLQLDRLWGDRQTQQKWNDNRRPSAAELNFGAHNTISKESVSRISDTFQGRIPPKLGGCDRAREFGKCTRAPCPSTCKWDAKNISPKEMQIDHCRRVKVHQRDSSVISTLEKRIDFWGMSITG